MTIAMCLDYISEFIDFNGKEDSDKPSVRQASQADMDRF
jgi:hypothetical protein